MSLSIHKSEDLDTPLQPVATDPRQLLRHAPMSFAQGVGVFLMLVLLALNGFDTLSASFVAPGVRTSWGLTHAMLGIIISMNLVGMTAGSIFLAPVGDKIGRRKTILIALVLVCISMFLSAAATGPLMLIILRLITGLSIGATIGSAAALAAEYANIKNRSLAVVCMGVGFPIGGAVGGVIVSVLLAHYSWRSVFVFGGGATLAVLLAMFFLLGESIGFLIDHPQPGALQSINQILERYGHKPLSAVPPAKTHENDRAAVKEIFLPGLRRITISMLLLQTGQITTVYYFLNWLPQMVADMGFHGAIAAKVAMWMNVGGIAGALVIGFGARKFNIMLLVGLMMAGSTVAVIFFSRTPPNLESLKIVASITGFMLLGCTIGLTPLLAQVFPSKVRATGIGVAYGCGHIGSIGASVIPGYLFTFGLKLPAVSVIMACGSIFAIAVLYQFARTNSSLNTV